MLFECIFHLLILEPCLLNISWKYNPQIKKRNELVVYFFLAGELAAAKTGSELEDNLSPVHHVAKSVIRKENLKKMLKFSNFHESVRKQIRPGIKKIVRLRLVSFVFVWLRGSYEIYDSICVLTVSVIQCDFVFGKYNPAF